MKPTNELNSNLTHKWAKGFRLKKNAIKVYHPYTYLDFKPPYLEKK